ncbi:MAG: efflux RND transporter permease subunit [Saprospiraceae bacterium]
MQQLSRQEMDHEVAQSSKKMMNSAVFGQVIILVVYLPIFTLEGIEGKMFKPMAQTVAFALIGAFILSLSYIPMMSSWILSRKLSHHPTLSDRIMFRVERIYQHALEKLLHFPKTVLGIILLLLFLSGWILTRLGGEFIPSLPEGDFAIDTRVLLAVI